MALPECNDDFWVGNVSNKHPNVYTALDWLGLRLDICCDRACRVASRRNCKLKVYLRGDKNDIESGFGPVRPLVFRLLLKEVVRSVPVDRLSTGCVTKLGVFFYS